MKEEDYALENIKKLLSSYSACSSPKKPVFSEPVKDPMLKGVSSGHSPKIERIGLSEVLFLLDRSSYELDLAKNIKPLEILDALDKVEEIKKKLEALKKEKKSRYRVYITVLTLIIFIVVFLLN